MNEEVIIYLLLYINDILMVISNPKENGYLKETLNIIINHEKCELLLLQSSYLKRVMNLFRTLDAKNVYQFFDHHTKLLIMNFFITKDEQKRW